MKKLERMGGVNCMPTEWKSSENISDIPCNSHQILRQTEVDCLIKKRRQLKNPKIQKRPWTLKRAENLLRKRRKREQTRSHFYKDPFNHCVDVVVVRVQWQGARLCCHRSNTGGTMTSCIAVLTTWSKKGETSQRKTTAEHHQICEEGQRRLKSLLLAAAKERGRNLNAASALFFAVICWGGSIGTGNTNSLKKPIEKASSVIGCKPDTMEAVMERENAE